MRNRISSQFVVISGTSQRIVHDFIETRTAELFWYQVLQLVTTVSSSLVAQVRFYILTELYIIISVDTKDIFYHIDITLYVDTVNRNMDSQTFFSLWNDFHFQAFQNTFNRFHRNILTDQGIDLVISQFYRIRQHRTRINILDSTGNLTASYFLDQQSGTLQYINGIVCIQTTFETERSIGIQTETPSRLTDPCRMETSRFQEHIRSLFRHTWIQATEHTTDTHCVFRVTDHQIMIGQRTFNTVQGNELRSFRLCFHDHFVSFYFTCIERVQRLPHFMQHKVSHVHYIINRTQTDYSQTVFQPFRTFFYRYAFDRHTGVTRTGFRIFNDHFDSRSFIVDLESVHRRAF